MGVITAIVQRLEAQAIATKAIFPCIAGKIEVTEEEFHYNMHRFQDLEINRVFGYCPQPWACKEYRTCRKTDCNKEHLGWV